LVAPDGVQGALWGALSPDERDRAERFVLERHRRRFVMARGVLRMILARYLQEPPEAISFEYSPLGKPGLARHLQPAGGLHFNLSHSEDLVVYAVARGPELGIDVERMRDLDDMEQLARISFSPTEFATWQGLARSHRRAAFFRCWTRKEAYIKATGAGFFQPLDQFDVTLAPDEPPRFLRIAGEPDAHLHWSLCDLTPAPGYAAALAVRARPGRVDCWQWAPVF